VIDVESFSLGVYYVYTLMMRLNMLTLQIRRWGNSSGIRIPSSVIQQLGWKDGDDLQAEVVERKLIISKYSSSLSVNPDDFATLSEAGVDVQAIVNDFIAHEALKLR